MINPKSKIQNPKSDGWQQGQLVELTITDLTDEGDGVGRPSTPMVSCTNCWRLRAIASALVVLSQTNAAAVNGSIFAMTIS
jgi:hypothetical protein